jgi:hypothetical protein
MIETEMVLGTSVIFNELTAEALEDFICLSPIKASDLQIAKPPVFMKLKQNVYIKLFNAKICPVVP